MATSSADFDRTPACDRRTDRRIDRHRAYRPITLVYRRTVKTKDFLPRRYRMSVASVSVGEMHRKQKYGGNALPY